MVRRTEQTVRSPVTRMAPTARSWALIQTRSENSGAKVTRRATISGGRSKGGGLRERWLVCHHRSWPTTLWICQPTWPKSSDDGLMQLGHSKDHRPDLPQVKLMAAVAEPTGLFLAGDVHPGNAADDPLYLPLYRRVRAMLDQTGLLYSGDCKMAALETRAAIAANQDFYLTRLPLTGAVQTQFSAWVEAAIVGEQAAQ